MSLVDFLIYLMWGAFGLVAVVTVVGYGMMTATIIPSLEPSPD